MKIHINKAHYPVTVLGPGRRLGIWMQGCNIHCPGCVSQDTWALTEESGLPVENFLEACRALTSGKCPDGFTISGGEPFFQPQALDLLLDGLEYWRKNEGVDADVLCYSGYSWSRIKDEYPQLLGKIDALIPEPFLEGYGEGFELRGSENQPLIPLTPLGEKRYSSMLETRRHSRMQVLADGARLWHIGIPCRNDMEEYERKCREKGIIMEHVSWRV